MQNAKEFLEELLNAGFIPEELEKETEKILGIKDSKENSSNQGDSFLKHQSKAYEELVDNCCKSCFDMYVEAIKREEN